MADSKQLLIMKALTTLIEGINPTEQNYALGIPFTLDLRKKVFRGRTIIGNDVTMPAVAILEAPTPVSAAQAAEEGVKKREDWRLLVQGFAADDKQNPTDPAYNLKAALEVQLSKVIALDGQGLPLFPAWHMLGNLVTGMTISQGVVRPPEEKVSQYAFCYIPVTVKLATDVRNPYTA